jgi:hypothetical protein
MKKPERVAEVYIAMSFIYVFSADRDACTWKQFYPYQLPGMGNVIVTMADAKPW